MQTFESGFELLEHLLANRPFSAADLAAFLKVRASDEGLHLDFKDGKELTKSRKERNFTLKKYVSAFANSDGGVLVYGVEDPKPPAPKSLAPVTPDTEGGLGEALERWASSVIAPWSGQLGIVPRLVSVDVTGGKVLLVAVARAPALISTRGKNDEEVFFFRIDDDARPSYPFLVSDLVLGRRQAPRFVVEPWGAKVGLIDAPRASTTPAQLTVRTDLHFLIKNESLVTAHRTVIGLVAFSFNPSRPPASTVLEAYLDIDPDGVPDFYFPLQHAPSWRGATDDNTKASATLRAFSMASAQLDGPWRAPRTETVEPVTWCAALYLVAEGCAPQWFQVELDIPPNVLPTAQSDVVMRVSPVVAGRPRVGRKRTAAVP